MRRVVVTGMGAVTSLGTDVQTLWEKVRAGEHGFSRIERFDPSNLGVTLAGEIKDWDPTAHGISKKDARRMDRYCQYAMAAANQAVAQAGDLSGLDPFRIGVIVGSGIGGFETFIDEHAKYLEKGPSRVSVFFIPMMISNMAAGQIAIQHGFKGVSFSAVSACATSAHAVGEAFHAIRYGQLDAAVTGGSEAAIDEFALAGFKNMGALTEGSDPDRLSIPFDKDRSGFVMSEGAGILLLEEYEHAKRRGAKILGEIVGYGATADAYHITSPDPTGEGPAKAMEFAVADAGITPDQVDYINAHGTSTPLNDLYETRAIKRAFGEHAYSLKVSSTKSETGHLLGAAGAVEAILTIRALAEGVLPPTRGLQDPGEECDLDYLPGTAREYPARYALSNSFGFGGQNATLAFKRFED